MFRSRLVSATSLASSAALVMVLLWVPSAGAATYTVGCPGVVGGSATTLPAAITAASLPGVDTIVLAPGCRYVLGATLSVVGATTTIVGNGATIDGGGAVRVFKVNPGAGLTLDHVTIANGSSNAGAGDAGGIYNDGGTVRLTNSEVRTSVGFDGGGIVNRGGTLVLTNSNVRHCQATNRGGGIFNNGGTLTIKNSSTVSDNIAAVDAGGIFNSYGSVSVTSSRLSDNSSAGTGGTGGMFNFSPTPTTFADSIISFNRGDGSGGFTNYGDLRLTAGSVLSDNRSAHDGGGIYNGSGVTIEDSTVTDNVADHAGGGILNANKVILKNSRLSNNRALIGGGIFNNGDVYPGSIPELRLTDSVVSHNRAGGRFGDPVQQGGGIYNLNSRMWATTSRISHNSAFGDGGGIYNKTTNTSIGITVRFMKSTLSDNHTDFKNTGGGGLANLGGARFEGSTVSDNVSTFGGGILNWGDLEVVQQSTVSDNQALREGGGVYNGVGMMGDASTIADNTAEESGGGIFSLGDITLTNFTIADNRAVNRDGGGIWNDGSFYENRGDVILTKSVVSGNRAENGFGGGIHSVDGDLDISGSTKEGSSRLYLNRAVWGGAIDNEGGDVTITRTAVTSNRALAGGGGLYNSAGGDAEMVRSVFSRNRADAGGGILNEATLTVDRSTISDNRGSFGGGIQSAGGASITASTLSDNQAEQFGGGVWASNGITILNSTLSGNTAEYWGGGLFVGAGQATVTWTTFMGNVGGKDALSTLDGGSIYNDSGIAVILSNSILASSRGGNTTSPTFSNCFGPMSVTKTLSDTTCAAASVGDPQLASSLALNLNSSSPYPTWTHALLAATPIMGLACPATDQRGLPHSRTDPCDIGSYEFP